MALARTHPLERSTADQISFKLASCTVWDGDENDDMQANNKVLQDAVAAYGSALERLERDENLSEDLKAKEARAAGAAALDAINKVEGVDVRPAMSRVAELRNAIEDKSGVKPTSAIDAATQAEMRAFLRQLPDQDRQRAISEAMQSGDVEVLRAVAGAPSAFKLCSSEITEGVRQSLARQTAPDEAKALAKLEDSLGRVTRNVGSTRRRLEGIIQDQNRRFDDQANRVNEAIRKARGR